MGVYRVEYPALWHNDTQQGFKELKEGFEKKLKNKWMDKVLGGFQRATGTELFLAMDYKPIDDRSTELILVFKAIGAMAYLTAGYAAKQEKKWVKDLVKQNPHLTVTEIK